MCGNKTKVPLWTQELLALLSTMRDAEAGDRSHTAAGTDWPVWKLADLESRIFATCQNIRGLFSTMAFNPSTSIICRDAHRLCTNCHLVPCRQMKHSPHVQVCTPTGLHIHWEHEGNKKSGLNILQLLFQLTLSYRLCNCKSLSKFCPITIKWAQHVYIFTLN